MGSRVFVIANNTFVIAAPTLAGQTSYGSQHTFANDASADSVFENNLMVTATADDRYASIDQHSGITVDYNLYSGLGVFAVGGVTKTFSEWGAATSFDAHSINADAMLVGAAEFNQTKAQKAVYDGSKAKPLTGSPATGAGTNLSATFSTDFTGATRASGAYEIGAVGH